MKRPVYIFSSGDLKRGDNTLEFIQEGRKRFMPIASVSELYVFGEVNFNKRLLEFLTENEVTVHFFNRYGWYTGTYYPRTHLNSGLITVRQAEHYLALPKRLFLAKAFVSGAISNSMKVLTYYSRRGLDLSLQEAKLAQLADSAARAESIDELMGVEGNAKSVYYTCFNPIINDERFRFEYRTRQPPRTKVDSLISFLNSLLYMNVLREIYMTHLDPRIGFLHESNFRSFSLNLDVAEVFRPVIVDRLIFSILNRHMLGESDFMDELNGVLLSDSGRRTVSKEFEDKMETTIQRGEKKASYRRLIRIELYKIERHIINDKPYQPFISEW